MSAHSYPEWFQAAVQNAWGPQAKQRLSGVVSSITGVQEASAEAARRWLLQQGHRPFLNEVALRSIVFGAPGLNRGTEASKAVDWVAESMGGELLLVEAKSTLDSSAVGQCMDGRDKFMATLEALRALALKGGRPLPRTKGLAITAKIISISGHSSWSVAEGGGPLLQHGAMKLVNGSPVSVVVVQFI
jgi:hypothetical protein